MTKVAEPLSYTRMVVYPNALLSQLKLEQLVNSVIHHVHNALEVQVFAQNVMELVVKSFYLVSNVIPLVL